MQSRKTSHPSIPPTNNSATRRFLIPLFEFFVQVKDLAAAHVAAVGYLLDGGDSVTLNLGTGHGTSIRHIVSSVECQLGLAVPVAYRSRRDGDPAILISDASRARQMLGFEAPSSDLSTIMRDAATAFV